MAGREFRVVCEIEPPTRPDLMHVRHQIGTLSKVGDTFLIPAVTVTGPAAADRSWWWPAGGGGDASGQAVARRPGSGFHHPLRQALDAAGVRRDFRTAIKTAEGIDPRQWTPRELRHSFVSLLSDNKVPLQVISLLVGHKSTLVTELPFLGPFTVEPASNATTTIDWVRRIRKARARPRRNSERCP